MEFDPVAFGRRVGAARVWRGLKPKQLGIALGRSSEAVNAIERGDRIEPPDKLLLEALARELNVDEPWLLTGTQPPWEATNGRATAPSEEMLDQALEEIAAVLERLVTRVSEPAHPAADHSSQRRQSA